MPKPQHANRRPTPGEALYVLDRLVKTRRVTEREIAAIVDDMHREMETIEHRLAELYAATGHDTSTATGRSRGAGHATRTRRRRTVTPELDRSRRIQGEYMGLIRHLHGQARERIKKLAEEQGREAAIKAMRSAG
jgi:hypothetical protein